MITSLSDIEDSKTWTFFRQVYYDIKPLNAGRQLLTILEDAPRLSPIKVYDRLSHPILNIIKWLLQPTTVITDVDLTARITLSYQTEPITPVFAAVDMSLEDLVYLMVAFDLPLSFVTFLRAGQDTFDKCRAINMISDSSYYCPLIVEQWLGYALPRAVLEERLDTLIKYEIFRPVLRTVVLATEPQVTELQAGHLDMLLPLLLSRYPPGLALRQALYRIIRSDDTTDSTWPLALDDSMPARLAEVNDYLFWLEIQPDWPPEVLADLEWFRPLIYLHLGGAPYTHKDILRLIQYVDNIWLRTYFQRLANTVMRDPTRLARPLTDWSMLAETTTDITLGISYKPELVFFWTGDTKHLTHYHNETFGWLVACYRAKIVLDGLVANLHRVDQGPLLWALREFNPANFVAYVRLRIKDRIPFDLALAECNIIEGLTEESTLDLTTFRHLGYEG